MNSSSSMPFAISGIIITGTFNCCAALAAARTHCWSSAWVCSPDSGMTVVKAHYGDSLRVLLRRLIEPLLSTLWVLPSASYKLGQLSSGVTTTSSRFHPNRFGRSPHIFAPHALQVSVANPDVHNILGLSRRDWNRECQSGVKGIFAATSWSPA